MWFNGHSFEVNIGWNCSLTPAHLHSFIPLFFLPLEQTPTLSSIPLFPPGLQNSCSPPSLIFPHLKPWSFLPMFIHSVPTSFKFPDFLPESPCHVRTWKSLSCPSCLLHVPCLISLPYTDLLMSLLPTVLCFSPLLHLSPAPFIICSVC